MLNILQVNFKHSQNRLKNEQWKYNHCRHWAFDFPFILCSMFNFGKIPALQRQHKKQSMLVTYECRFLNTFFTEDILQKFLYKYFPLSIAFSTHFINVRLFLKTHTIWIYVCGDLFICTLTLSLRFLTWTQEFCCLL